jgi:hypothetical protein
MEAIIPTAADEEGRVSDSGAVPLRPLGVAEVLDYSVRLVRRNGRAVMSISVPFAVVRTGAVAVLQYTAIESKDAATIVAVGGLILAAGLGAVLTGLLAPIFSAHLLGRTVTAGAAVREVGGRTASLLLLGLVVTVAEGAGLLACGVGGIWLWGVWAVGAPALVLERLPAFPALRRSFRLVRGSFWRTWGIRALGWVLTSILGLFVTLPAQALASYLTGADFLDPASGVHQAALYVTVIAIGGLIAAAVLAPVTAAVDVLLYTDLRMRREGMDIVLSMPPSGRAAPAGPPAVTAW